MTHPRALPLRVFSCLTALLVPALASPAAAADFDGDGIADLAVYHAEAGDWHVWLSETGRAHRFNWGWAEAQPVPGDYDGDGIADPAVYVAHEGLWYIFMSSLGRTVVFELGGPGDRPVPGDYDGDGVTDPAVYERMAGLWRIRESRTGRVRTEQFGWSEAKPVPGDYDGDGITDLAVYHPAEGRWYLQRSRDGFDSIPFGYPGVRPVPADYDGDGTTDLAVYNRHTGRWYGFGSTSGSFSAQWGFYRARPVPADYDGDGKADLAVYERATGRWHILQSSTGEGRTVDWGWEQATPLAAYAHGGIEGGVVLCFGDSITYGRGSSSNGPAHGYPARLERRLGPAFGGHFHVVNAGLPGETTTRGLLRIDMILREVRPDLLLLMEGTNDLRSGTSFRTIENNLWAMAGRARAAGCQVVLSSIPPVTPIYDSARSGQAANVRAFNARFVPLAVSLNAPLAFVYEAIRANPRWEREWMFAASGQGHHPNDAGYAVMAEEFLRTLRAAYRDGRLD